MAMDKYEFNLKVDQMRKQYDLHDYQTAMKIADGIDWRRVTNVNLLSLVSDIYEKNGELEEAKEILLLAMESASNARHIVFRLTELAIRTGNMEEADAFCAEFEDLAHDDPRKYLLQYKILSAKGAAPEQKIIPLERYTATEIDEQWMYELAEQYLEAGQTAKCVAMCDRIMLFFGTGEYVQKAAELKADGAGAALSAYQQDLINNREKAEEKLRITEEKCRQAAESGIRRMSAGPVFCRTVSVMHTGSLKRDAAEERQTLIRREHHGKTAGHSCIPPCIPTSLWTWSFLCLAQMI